MSSNLQWPKEVLDKYEPVRILGKGGFASVFLAKRKSTTEEKKEKFVAIKLVRAKTKTETHYAHREIDILKEINHPNIMKLIESWEPDASTGVAIMAVTYARGRTLHYLLKNVGAPSLTFSRVVIAQLMDAVSHLHSHATIHRDIKPDNVVIKNISLDDKAILEDGLDETNWPALRATWHLTLLDFGFARALSSSDIEVEANKNRLSVTDHLISETVAAMKSKSKSSSQYKRHSVEDPGNMSHHIVRSLSALGNRGYAAPEVKHARKKDSADQKSCDLTVNATLAPFVSDYGLVADAFSVGSTIRFILTGVSPFESVEEVIASHNNPVNKAARWIHGKLKKKGVKTKKRYRSSADIPVEAVRLVKGLTQPNASKRTTVRDARLDPYVDEVVGGSTPFKKEMRYLKCAQQ